MLMDRGHLKLSPDNAQKFLYPYDNTREILISQKVMFYQLSRIIKIIIKIHHLFHQFNLQIVGKCYSSFLKGEELKHNKVANLFTKVFKLPWLAHLSFVNYRPYSVSSSKRESNKRKSHFNSVF